VNWESALSSCVQVGIGLTGFSGIIAALRSGADRWTQEDRVGFEILLGASGWATLFSLVPFVALDFLPAEGAWNDLSFAYASLFVGIGAYRFIEYRRGRLTRANVVRFVVAAPPIAALLVANGIWFGTAWVYVAVVMYQLIVAFLSFVRLFQPRRETLA
jgi:hypothetical protein